MALNGFFMCRYYQHPSGGGKKSKIGKHKETNLIYSGIYTNVRDSAKLSYYP